MKRALWVVLVVGCGSTKAPPQVRPVAPPVAEEPAFDPPRPELRLPRHFTPTRYTARLAIDPAQPEFAGEIAIDGNLDRRSAVIWLHGDHLKIASAKASDGTREVTLTAKAQGDLIELRPAHPLDPGHWTIALAYRGVIEQNGFEGAYLTKLGEVRYVLTQFEATAARLVFPCIDEPDRKTPWQLTLDVPKQLVAVSNTAPTGTTAIDVTHVRIAYAVTRPLPSYLVAFAVGPFEVIAAGTAKSGVPLRVITPAGTAKQVAFLVSALPKIVDTLEGWFGIPFPYPKLDIVVAPSLRGGAMENAGMITTDAKIVMNERPAAGDRYGLISTIGHETAHQWFGDLVTAAWWDDIWLNESFATWIEDKVLLGFDKTWPTEAIEHRQTAFHADELLTARKLRQSIETVGDIHNVFDSITYPKGATVLRMLEHQLGETAFQSAIHTYLLAHADGTATAADLFAALDGAGTPLGTLATGWFDQAGVPEVAMDLTCDGSGKATLALAQKRYLPDPMKTVPEQTWTIPVCVAFASPALPGEAALPHGSAGSKDGAKHERLEQCTVLAKTEGELALPVCPTWFAPAGDYGYYHARLDAQALTAIRDHGWKALTPAEHISIYDDAYRFARGGAPALEAVWSFAQQLARGDQREAAVALGDVFAAGSGTGLPPDIANVIPKELLGAARLKVRPLAERYAKTFGLVAPADETLVTGNLRSAVMASLAWSHSTVFDAEAKRLAAHYRDLSIETMRTVLDFAANADPKLATQLRADLPHEQDPVIHDVLLGVLAGLRDPAQHRAMLASLAADPALAPEDLGQIWAAGDNEARAIEEDYLRSNLDAVVQRMPATDNEDSPMVLNLVPVFTDACDPARRDELAAFVTQHFAKVSAGVRPVKQAIEGMDNCIARKRLLEPSLRAWLTAKP